MNTFTGLRDSETLKVYLAHLNPIVLHKNNSINH